MLIGLIIIMSGILALSLFRVLDSTKEIKALIRKVEALSQMLSTSEKGNQLLFKELLSHIK